MKKLDELLLCDWEIEINIGANGLYYIDAKHWQHRPILTAGDSLKNAIDNLYKLVWSVIK